MGTDLIRVGRRPHRLFPGVRAGVGAVVLSMLLQGDPMGLAQQFPASRAQNGPLVPAAAPVAASGARTMDPAQEEWAKQSAQLLLLATQLKREVDKTTENILSVKVIEKAREIERFTHATEQQLKAQN